MARPIRIEYGGASYHAMACGNERREIFCVEVDRGGGTVLPVIKSLEKVESNRSKRQKYEQLMSRIES